MIEPKKIVKFLLKKKINFFSGVPDSTISSFIDELVKNKKIQHQVSVNEGSSIASAIGYHLATKKIPVVYMQNSGISNALNPILSLCNDKLYNLPIIIFIGLRGVIGFNKEKKEDEPQHILIGPKTNQLLKLANIKFTYLNKKNYLNQINKIIKIIKKKPGIHAIIVKRGLFKNIKKNNSRKNLSKRIDYLELLHKYKNNNDIFVCSTGYTAREFYYLNEINKSGHSKTFYCVGAMGHASTIAKEIAKIKKKNRIFMLDGDGAALMHLGTLTSNLNLKLQNFIHIIFNNGSHESTGGHPITTSLFSFSQMFKICGYKKVFKITNPLIFNTVLNKIINKKILGPIGIEIKINTGTLKNLPRQDSPKILQKLINF